METRRKSSALVRASVALAGLVRHPGLTSRTIVSPTTVTGLAALAPGLGGKRAVLREAAFRARNTLSALASGFGRKTAVLREAALRVRDGLATHARDFPLSFRIHRGEAAVRSTSVLSPALSHHHTPLLLSL